MSGLIFDDHGIKLYQSSNIDVLTTLADGSIDLTVTSPPYDDLRSYDKTQPAFEQFHQLVAELYRLTVAGGVVVWIVGDQTINGSETGSSLRQAVHFLDCDFLLADTMIYKKANPGGARGSNKTYIQCFEYMFVFSKGPLRIFNLLKDRPNKRPGVQKGGGRREHDGRVSETLLYASPDLGRRFNIWEYPTQTDEFSARHPAPFPLALARDHILSWSNPGDTVLDPFAGSGTTLAAAMTEQRQAIGIDISAEYADLAKARLSNLAFQQNTARLLCLTD